MLNTIRADFYRLFHSKGFYFTLIALLLIVINTVLSQHSQGLMFFTVNGESVAISNDIGEMKWTGANTLIQMTSSISNLMYLCLPLFVITIGYDLTRKTYKNLLTAGVSRMNFFLSKYAVFMIMCAMQFVIYYGASFLVGSVRHGAGSFTGDMLVHFAKAVGIQFLCLQGIFVFAVIILNLMSSNVAAVIAVIVFPLILTMLAVLNKDIDWFQYLNFQSNMDLSWSTSVPADYWTKVVIAGLLTLGLGSVCSFSIFKKRDF